MFVADPDGTAEGDGWIFLVVYRSESHRSDVVVLDARAIADGPIASIELPVRVPYGFHAAWSPARPDRTARARQVRESSTSTETGR